MRKTRGVPVNLRCGKTQFLHGPWDAGVHVPGMPPDGHMTNTIRSIDDGEIPDVRHRFHNRVIESEGKAGAEGDAHSPACLREYYESILKTSWLERRVRFDGRPTMEDQLMCRIGKGYFQCPQVFEACQSHLRASVTGKRKSR